MSRESPPVSPSKQGASNEAPVPLPRLIHALHTVADVPVVDAISIVRVLAHKKRHTPEVLRRISAPELEELGAPCTGPTRDRVVQTLQSVGESVDPGAIGASAMTDAERLSKQQRMCADIRLRRDWGNVQHAAPADDDDDKPLTFDPVLNETSLRGRCVVVNRAPVMTAWAVTVLGCMGFTTNEALSLAHCYVSTTADARAQSLGIQRSQKPPSGHVMSENQPHVEFMRVKIPVMTQRHGGEYRGLLNGEVVSPMRAYDYLRRSMYQMLPYVMGALLLLATSYVGPDGNADELHKAAYGLYLDFRPETHGEWGKRATLMLDKVLELRARKEDKEPASES